MKKIMLPLLCLSSFALGSIIIEWPCTVSIYNNSSHNFLLIALDTSLANSLVSVKCTQLSSWEYCGIIGEKEVYCWTALIQPPPIGVIAKITINGYWTYQPTSATVGTLDLLAEDGETILARVYGVPEPITLLQLAVGATLCRWRFGIKR